MCKAFLYIVSAEKKLTQVVTLVIVLLWTMPMGNAQRDDIWHDVDLTLNGALWQKTSSPASPKYVYTDLTLHLGYRDGKWRSDILGWAGQQRDSHGVLKHHEQTYNQMDHEGTVVARTADDGTLVLTVKMVVHPDPWLDGGEGEYTIRLKRDGDSFTGKFEGEYESRNVGGEVTGKLMAKPWPSPVEGVAPTSANEHPRLLFRKSDLPALRARMKTPEGQAILARLHATLGGKKMPTEFSKAKHAYDKAGRKMDMGAYTLWHAMGFGFLYQLTGDEEYADLARQCVDKARAGIRDRDPRYAYVRPGGKLRAGSSYAAIAMAYDLCYDAWPPAYREKLAREIQDRVFLPGQPDNHNRAMAEPVNVGLVFKTGGGQHSAWSNHYGAWNGGGGSAILAIMGDDGTDDEITQRSHRIFLRRAKRALQVGYGDAGYFFEGHHGGRLSSNTGLVTYLNHLRTSQGLDLVPNSPEAQWLISKWMFEIIRQGNELRSPQRGIYASPVFKRGGMSTGGDFARGFGIAPQAHRPALKWFYNHVVEPEPPNTYDAIIYPHHAVYAFLYWPIEEEPKNPAGVVGKVLRDRKARYVVFRSGWSGTDDDVIVALHHGGGPVIGMGMRGHINAAGGQETDYKQISEDTYVIHYGDEALVADLNGPAGSPVTLIHVRFLREEPVTVKTDGRPLTDKEKQLLEMLRKSRQASLKKMLANLPEDPPAVADDKPATIERHRALGTHHVTVHTVARGPVPSITMSGEGEQARLVIGQLTIQVEGEQVVVKIEK